MAIIATYSIKGGVGKTTTAVNIAWCAARAGLRTLVWDLDPQGAASFYFRIPPRIKAGAKRLLRNRSIAGRYIKETDFEALDLLPADFSYRKLDIVLDRRKHPKTHLKRMLRPLAREYDLIVLDCAPSISLVSENVMHAADAALVPVIPTTLSVRTLDQLLAFRRRHDPGACEILPFLCMVDRRKSLHRELSHALAEDRPELLEAQIPFAATVERMGTHRAPLGAFAGASAPAKAYEALWAEIFARVWGNGHEAGGAGTHVDPTNGRS